MPIEDSFYADVGEILLAHEFVLDRAHKCEYPNGRGKYGVIYAIDGQAEFRFLGAPTVTVSTGDALFLPPNATYRIVTKKEFRHYTVNFTVRRETSALGTMDSSYCLLKKEKSGGVERELRELVGLWKAKKTGYRMRATGCLYRLLSDFYGAYEDEESDGVGRLFPAKAYLERNLADSTRLDHLAKLCSMSVSNFRREWKKLYGGSPLQYRDTVRLQNAKEYLISGYYSVSEVAVRCGFEDPSYFVRFFKKHEGVTPGEWKRQTIGK